MTGSIFHVGFIFFRSSGLVNFDGVMGSSLTSGFKGFGLGTLDSDAVESETSELKSLFKVCLFAPRFALRTRLLLRLGFAGIALKPLRYSFRPFAVSE